MKIRPLFTNRWFYFGLFAIASLLAFLLYKRSAAWNQIQQELASKGESFDLSDNFAPRIPDADNFAATPALHNIRTDESKRDDITSIIDWKAPELSDYVHGKAKIELATQADPRKYLAYLLGEPSETFDGLDYQQTYTRILAELQRRDKNGILVEIGALPIFASSQFLPTWREYCEDPYSVPHLSPLLDLSRTLALQSQAAIALKRDELAEQSICSILQLIAGFNHEPYAISTLVTATSHGIAMNTLWSGLENRTFSNEQLEKLQHLLERLDFQASYAAAMRAELAAAINLLDDVALYSAGAKSALGFETPIISDIYLWGTRDISKARYSEWYFEDFIYPIESGFPALVLRIGAVSPTRTSSTSILKSVSEALPRISYPVMPKIAQNIVLTEAFNNLAITACALERFFVENNDYPDTLSELVPKYIVTVPTDPIDGAPLRYVKDPTNSRYKVYSIGLDASDNGGATHIGDEEGDETKFSSTSYRGDWTWRYPSLKN